MVNFSEIIGRMKLLVGVKTDKELGLIIGLSAPDFSKRKKSGTILPLIINYGIAEKVNLDWLITGKGEAARWPSKKIRVAEKSPIYNKVNEEPETDDLLSMTRDIFKSSTDYSTSLAANVRSFHRAIKTEKRLKEKRLNKMEGELTVLKNMFTDLARENEKLKRRLDNKKNPSKRKIAVGEKWT